MKDGHLKIQYTTVFWQELFHISKVQKMFIPSEWSVILQQNAPWFKSYFFISDWCWN